jgi:hypothetical protein
LEFQITGTPTGMRLTVMQNRLHVSATAFSISRANSPNFLSSPCSPGRFSIE